MLLYMFNVYIYIICVNGTRSDLYYIKGYPLTSADEKPNKLEQRVRTRLIYLREKCNLLREARALRAQMQFVIFISIINISLLVIL